MISNLGDDPNFKDEEEEVEEDAGGEEEVDIGGQQKSIGEHQADDRPATGSQPNDVNDVEDQVAEESPKESS